MKEKIVPNQKIRKLKTLKTKSVDLTQNLNHLILQITLKNDLNLAPYYSLSMNLKYPNNKPNKLKQELEASNKKKIKFLKKLNNSNNTQIKYCKYLK